MGHCDNSYALVSVISKLLQVLHQPHQVAGIEVPSWLIKKKQVRLLQHRSGQSEFHAPAAAQGSDWHLHAAPLCKAKLLQRLLDSFVCKLLGANELVRGKVLRRRHLTLRRSLSNAMLHQAGGQLLRAGKPNHLAIVDGPQQAALAAVVAANQAVDASAQQSEASAAQQGGRTPGEHHRAVAEHTSRGHLVLLLAIEALLLPGSLACLLRLQALRYAVQLQDEVVNILVPNQRQQVWQKARPPRRLLTHTAPRHANAEHHYEVHDDIAHWRRTRREHLTRGETLGGGLRT
mmetsp:Transcript_53728/g.128009  ORF Transcript_53728/g.128009 Transcript_53728/m.128009 type:complete len:290 (+) Transcript_53728:1509-2378(+)